MKNLHHFLLAMGVAIAVPTFALAADGEATFDKNCAVCHKVISPKLGDKAAWAPRIAQGNDALFNSVTHGKGAMPPRAGHPDLSDDDIRAAIAYIVSKAK